VYLVSITPGDYSRAFQESKESKMQSRKEFSNRPRQIVALSRWCWLLWNHWNFTSCHDLRIDEAFDDNFNHYRLKNILQSRKFSRNVEFSLHVSLLCDLLRDCLHHIISRGFSIKNCPRAPKQFNRFSAFARYWDAIIRYYRQHKDDNFFRRKSRDIEWAGRIISTMKPCVFFFCWKLVGLFR